MLRPVMGRFLGLDSSTQSLSALVIDTDVGKVAAGANVVFGERLPQYRSPKGFLPAEDPQVRHSDPLMWVEALDLVLSDLRSAGVDLGAVRGVSGAGQQHGSVYLATSLDEVRGWPAAGAPLVDQVRPLLSRTTAPIWMDSSTGAECAEITAAVGGDDRVVALSGSVATPRFTGPQIRKFYKDRPGEWERTAEIHLVSSFVASLLVGASAPIDLGDGAGMNLLELASGAWSQALLDATAPGLGRRLKAPVPSATRVGVVADYFVARYGFSAGTPVIAFTGDNPSSLIGMGASRPGTAVVSLGTSDTMFAAMAAPRVDPGGFGYVFGNPAGGFMALCCFANGSLAREEVARHHAMDWDDFTRAILDRTSPGNGGNLLLPYFVPEITPRIPSPAPRRFGSEDFVAGQDAAADARAVVEAQALAMRHYSSWIDEATDTLLVTGGASKNPGILQILADVFQAKILPLRVSNSSALGGALRAAQAVEGRSWEELYARFAAPDVHRRVLPDPGARGAYRDLAGALERRIDDVLAESAGKR
jgi:xylulokinase